MKTNDKLAKRNLYIMMGAQAFAGGQMPMLFIVAGLAGQSFDINICWATLPISLIVFGSMTTAPWLSSVMQNFGRRFGFIIGSSGGAIGGALSVRGSHSGLSKTGWKPFQK